MRRYQTPHALAPEVGAVITDTLETLAREGARAMLDRALRAEVDEHLGRARYERGPTFTGFRTGMPGRARSASGPGRSRSARHG